MGGGSRLGRRCIRGRWGGYSILLGLRKRVGDDRAKEMGVFIFVAYTSL